MGVQMSIGADGGMAVSAPAGQRRLDLSMRELRALDLQDSPDLVELDIRDAGQPEATFHLAVTGCPGLRRVRLPAATSAIVHLDTGPQVPDLILEGRIEQVDACWHGGAFLLQAEDGALWNGACITRLDPSESTVTVAGHGLQVRIGADRRAEALEIHGDLALRALALVGLGHTRQLRWPRVAPSHCPSFQVFDAPDLETLELQRQVHHLLVEGCPAVVRIAEAGLVDEAAMPDEPQGTPRRVQLRRGSGARSGLAVDWPCDELSVFDSLATRLVVRQCGDVVLLRNWKLDDVSLPHGCRVACEGYVPRSLAGSAGLFVDRGLLRALVARYRAGEVEAWQAFEAALAVASGRNHATVALQELASACEAGLAPDVAWATRMALYARHRAHSGAREPRDLSQAQIDAAAQSWSWDLASDLAEDGLRADWAIWLHCGELPEAAAYGDVMVREVCAGGSTVQTGMVHWLFRPPQTRPPRAQAWLAQLCRTVSRQSTHNAPVADAIEAFLKFSAHQAPEYAPLRDAAFDHALRWGQPRATLELLQQLMDDPAHRARARLLLIGLLREPPLTVDAKSLAGFQAAARALLLTNRLPA